MSRLNTPPACAPVNASLPALRPQAHDSEPVWLARPSPYGSFIHTSTPVYPGAPLISNSNSLCRERDAQSVGRRLLHAITGFELPRVRTESNDDEYSQPFRHIQYNRTASRRPIATLAMLLCRRIARCMYRRRQCGLMRAAAWAASTNKKRNKELPCLLMCPSRCLRARDSSHGIIPTYVPICLPR